MRNKPQRKNKKKIQKKTILIVGEGLHEYVFIQHLRSIIIPISSISITPKRGNGGSPVDIVYIAVKDVGSYDIRVVILDNYRPEAEMQAAEAEAAQSAVFLIKNKPCLEALLLAMLEKGKDYSNHSEVQCKKIFQAKYIPEGRRSELLHYKKHFPLKLLDQRRKDIAVLERIMRLLEKGEID